jgi:glycosyltransferase involved in cell wall biosynthesis
MKILIVRYTDQPAMNICKNIAKYSKYDCIIVNRDVDIRLYYDNYDVIFYYNINDLVYDSVMPIYNTIKKSNYKICVGVQSHRIFDFGFIPRVKSLNNIVGFCSPKSSTMEELQEALDHKDLIYTLTPFTADESLFKHKKDVNFNGKLRVGYVGSDTPNKRFNDVIKPAFEILKDEIDPLLYGKVGKRVPHSEMCDEYNKMDCLVVSSSRNGSARRVETGPMPPIEAALCGRPTITTRCGIMPETFDDNQAIFHDASIEGLVKAIRTFVRNRKLCKEMGLRARQKVLTDRSWPVLVTHQDDFFQRVYKEIVNV